MAFLKYMDSLVMVAAMLILVIMIYRISRSNKTELTLWFAGSIVIVMALFLTTTGNIINTVEEVSTFNPFYIGVIALALALMSSGYLSLIDKNKKIASYYTVVSLVLAIIVGYVAVYGSVTSEVLLKPLFLILVIASFILLIVSPIIAVVTKKANIHSLWSIIGWAAIAFAGWTQWQAYTGALVLEADPFDARLFTALFIGALCLALDFGFSDWHLDKADNKEITA